MKALSILSLMALSLALASSAQAQFRMPYIRFSAEDLENIKAAAAKAAAAVPQGIPAADPAANAASGSAAKPGAKPAANPVVNPAVKPADAAAASAAGAAAFRRDFMPSGRFFPPSAQVPAAPPVREPAAGQVADAPVPQRRDEPPAAADPPAMATDTFGYIPEPGFVMPGLTNPEGTVVETVEVVEILGDSDVIPSDSDPDEVSSIDMDDYALPAPDLQARGQSGSSWEYAAFKSNWASTWKITKDTYGDQNRDLVPDPTGSSPGDVLQITYPAGTRNPKDGKIGGTGFYASPIDLSSARTVTFSYEILFPKGFNFVKGGKLPGLYDRSLQTKAFCNVPPVTLCNPTYGASMGRGSYTFTPGKWTSVSQTITLNSFKGKTPNKDGRVQVIVNGKKAIDFAQVVFVAKPSVGFEGIDFETFFGGNDDSWATPTTQRVYFKNFALSAS
ncbi:hypothetical protein HDU86_005888 [Geranomyces michiganensis]|nr:hypothetical protein HDU86_005888 [Geranomyces michiganensis]